MTKFSKEDMDRARSFIISCRDPFFFIESMWGLVPQPAKPEYDVWNIDPTEWTANMFGDPVGPYEWKWHDFEKGKHITWQQTVVLLGIKQAVDGYGNVPNEISVKSGNGIGKAQRKDLMIDTPSGKKRFGDIVPGDYVFGADGMPTKVVAIHDRGLLKTYKVLFDDGSSTVVCGDHLWKARYRNSHGNNGWSIISTDNIIKKGIKRKNGKAPANCWDIPIQGMAMFPEQETDLDPYLVGIWIGDGTINKPEYTKESVAIKEKIKSLEYKINTTSGGTNRIQNKTKEFKEGVFSLHSYDRFIPDVYKYNSIQKRLSLFCGLVDADGEVNRSGSIGYSTTSKKLADDVVWLARSLGCKAMLQNKIKKSFYYGKGGNKISGKDCYRITINSPFNPFTHEDKKKKWKASEDRYQRRFIEDIEDDEVAECMCITVENEDGLYLTNDFIVTHNSCMLSWIVLWFLFAFYQSQVPCTAPTTGQMHDVLWKEISMWLNKMPDIYKDLYDYTSDYIRMKTSPESWFARARTARKENPEAFSGIHAEKVLLLADEASGVDDVIYDFGKGATTGPFWIFLLFSNPTRLVGKFKKTFDPGSGWRNFSFNSSQSPVVAPRFVEGKIRDSGVDSDDFRVFVEGGFPKSDSVDDQGYVPLVTPEMLNDAMCDDVDTKFKILGVDPSGEGNDKSAFVVRNEFFAKIVAEEQISTPKSVASKGHMISTACGISADQIVIDNMGEGANVSLEFAQLGQITTPISVKDKPILEEERKKYLNLRAKACWELREWLKKGGRLIRDPRWNELLNVRYRYNEAGLLQIMPKEMMKKKGIPSPNFFDGLMLTFLAPPPKIQSTKPANYDILYMRKKLGM